MFFFGPYFYKVLSVIFPGIFSYTSLFFILTHCLVCLHTNDVFPPICFRAKVWIWSSISCTHISFFLSFDCWVCSPSSSRHLQTSLKVTFGFVSDLCAAWLSARILSRSFLWSIKVMFLDQCMITYTCVWKMDVFDQAGRCIAAEVIWLLDIFWGIKLDENSID